MFKRFIISFLWLVFFSLPLEAALVSVEKMDDGLMIETLYGSELITEPVLVEIIQSKAFNRLKEIHQYGSEFYLRPTAIPYSRYEHSVAVMMMIRKYGGDLKAQIAGLIHDISHTVFSHSTEPLFKGGYIHGNYQDEIHIRFLKQYGIEDILKKHGYIAEEMNLMNYPILKKSGYELCADNVEYNLDGGYIDEVFSKEDLALMVSHLFFDGADWYFDDVESAKMLAESALHQTITRWGGGQAYFIGLWTSEMLAEALKNRIVTIADIEFDKTDDEIWKLLENSKNSYIQKKMKMCKSFKTVLEEVKDDHFDKIVLTKFRGIDPLVLIDGEKKHLTEINENYKSKFQDTKRRIENGFKMRVKKIK